MYSSSSLNVPLVGGSEVTLLEGTTFCISSTSGDIVAGAEQGLFFRDSRFVSRMVLEVSGVPTDALGVQRPAPYAGVFVSRRPPKDGMGDSTLLVVRRRYVGNGMLEEIEVRNLGREAAAVHLCLNVDADFAGLFEVKEGRVRPKDGLERSAEGEELTFTYRKGGESRAVRVRGAEARAIIGQLHWQVAVPAKGSWTTYVEVVPYVDEVPAAIRYRPGVPLEASEPAAELAAWRRRVPLIHTPDEDLARVVATSEEDLGSLRVADPDEPSQVVVAAGAPWFMTLFGRDSILTSWMLLPLDPSLALGTLRTLARMQGKRVDPLTEEEPGRILHEVRSGLESDMPLGLRNIYYGSVDATPLFVMLLGELHRWGLSQGALDELLPAADAALEWIEKYGDRDDDGFVEYQRATDRGLINQGWKDSFDSISFKEGRLAEPPIALCEVQGYVYAAYLARSHFAREMGDHRLAAHWAGKAGALKRRFNEAFWLEDKGYFAIALDGSKRPVDSLASNMGHCLWTGIVDEDKAAAVAKQLLSPELFSGFGVRTLARSMGAYNPISYHNGSVWPHDTTIVAAGLMRYGFVEEALRLIEGLLDAAAAFGGRLPELFCGFDRSEFGAPIPYPTSCSPQAWAAASPIYLLRILLRLDPAVPQGKVSLSPVLPDRYLPLRLERLHLAGGSVSIEVTESGWDLTGLPEGISLERSPRHPVTGVLGHLGQEL